MARADISKFRYAFMGGRENFVLDAEPQSAGLLSLIDHHISVRTAKSGENQVETWAGNQGERGASH